MTRIKQATLTELEDIIPLFNAYRLFYGEPINETASFVFLKDRLEKKESVILLSYKNKVPVGFTQLYPTYSSVSLKATLILNDLFVHENYRKMGVAKSLLDAAKGYCLENNYKGLALETAIDNPAQYVYEKLGWEKDVHCFHYFWTAK